VPLPVPEHDRGGVPQPSRDASHRNYVLQLGGSIPTGLGTVSAPICSSNQVHLVEFKTHNVRYAAHLAPAHYRYPCCEGMQLRDDTLARPRSHIAMKYCFAIASSARVINKLGRPRACPPSRFLAVKSRKRFVVTAPYENAYTLTKPQTDCHPGNNLPRSDAVSYIILKKLVSKLEVGLSSVHPMTSISHGGLTQ